MSAHADQQDTYKASMEEMVDRSGLSWQSWTQCNAPSHTHKLSLEQQDANNLNELRYAPKEHRSSRRPKGCPQFRLVAPGWGAQGPHRSSDAEHVAASKAQAFLVEQQGMRSEVNAIGRLTGQAEARSEAHAAPPTGLEKQLRTLETLSSAPGALDALLEMQVLKLQEEQSRTSAEHTAAHSSVLEALHANVSVQSRTAGNSRCRIRKVRGHA